MTPLQHATGIPVYTYSGGIHNHYQNMLVKRMPAETLAFYTEYVRTMPYNISSMSTAITIVGSCEYSYVGRDAVCQCKSPRNSEHIFHVAGVASQGG